MIWDTIIHILAIIGFLSILAFFGRISSQKRNPVGSKYLQLEVDERSRHRLEQLRVLSEKKDEGQIIAVALTMYECLWREVARDGQVRVHYPDGTSRNLALK